MKSAQYWIDKLELKSHPEGGYYKEVYRSTDFVQHPVHAKSRNLATSIYFLLSGNEISHFHELQSDELWYFHDGNGAIIHVFEQGEYKQHLLSNSDKGLPQAVIPAGSQFAAEVTDQKGYVLMGCMVSPGFDFEDFRMMEKSEMLRRYPEYEKLIQKFCLG